MTRSERTLWRRWVERRDGEAFAALVRRHARFVYDFARRVAGNPADAEDLTQEAYLKLAEAEPHEPDEVGLRAFLGRRVVLGARMLKRAALARRRHEEFAPPPSPGPGPDVLARREEAERALAVLAEGERRAVELRFLHDLPYAEIGVILGTSEEAARMRVHRGLERLKARLGRDASACLATLALFEAPARMLGSTARTALLTGGAVVAQSTGNKVVVAAALLLLAGLTGTVAVQWAGSGADEATISRAPEAAARNGESAKPDPELGLNGASESATEPRLSGSVVDAEGVPVPDATVRLLRYGGGGKWLERRSDESGGFSFEGRAGWVEARHPSYATTSIEIDASKAVQLVLQTGVLVRVEVYGAGRPITGARVAATDRSPVYLTMPGYRAIGEGTTDTHGVAELRVPPGRFKVWSGAKGWAPKLAPPMVCALGRPQRVRLELGRGGFVEGAVRDGTGAPVADARVVVQAAPGFLGTTRTDAEGRYVLEHVPLVSGPWLVVAAERPDHGATSASREWNAGDGNRMRFDLVFRRTARLHGVALDADGRPLADRRVVVNYPGARFHLLYGGYAWMTSDWPFATRTDADGRFALTGLPPGEAKIIVLPEFRDAVAVELRPGGALGPIEVRVAAIALRGIVLDAGGVPIAGAHIHPGDETTDDGGRFALKVRPDKLVVRADGHVPVELAVDADDVELRLPDDSIAGRAIDPSGRGLPGVPVVVQASLGNQMHHTKGLTDDHGHFRFRGATTHVYELSVRAPGRELVVGDSFVTGPKKDVVLILATPDQAERRRVRGTLVDAAGKPIDETAQYRRFSTERWYSQSHWATRRAGQPGSFVCEQLAPEGKMALVFSAHGYLWSDPVEVFFDGRTPVEPLKVILRRGAELEVVVREGDGTPVPGAYVYTHGVRVVNGRTDTHGRCILTGIPPGRCTVTATHPHLADVNKSQVDVTTDVRRRVEFQGTAAGLITMQLPPGLKPETSAVFRLLNGRGTIVRESRYEGAALRTMIRQWPTGWLHQFQVTEPGTYRAQCEFDAKEIANEEVEARLRETVAIEVKPDR